jgi:hypothetical protein
MRQQIGAMCKSAHYHLRNIGMIRKYITKEACEQLVHSFITSRLDYGNALLYGLPDVHLNRLQRILNIAARIVTLTPSASHITPVLKALHWLPVQQRIDFKILLLTFRGLNGLAPDYIAELLVSYKPRAGLRSESKNLLVLPQTSCKTLGDRAFSFSAPFLWNNLPLEIRSISNINAFKSAIKTHLFLKAY